MALQSAAGATLAIGTTAADPATDTFNDIEPLESIGEFGDDFASVQFTGLSDSRVQKFKGSADAGDLSFSYGLDVADAGQIALVAAAADTTGVYNFKVTYSGGEVRNFKGIVSTLRESAQSDAILMVNGTIRINSAITKS